MTKDEFYMQRAINLAKQALGNTYPNPVVGCVIVYNDEIIGEGYHQKAGEAHAEINAINSVKNKELLAESDIYVTLEPCAHYGKTPPCALKIKEIGFKRVIIGTLDSHDKVDGKGKKIIEDAGIEVKTGILQKECKELNKRFFTFIEKKRPYILLKWAQSDDGFLDNNYQPTAISNPIINQLTHKLRSQENAILVGTNTAINDNPSLTTRNIEGNNPTRIVIDWDLKIPTDYKIFNQEAKTIIFNSIRNEIKGNLQFIKVLKENSLQEILKSLHDLQIQSVIIEGGSFTLNQFIKANLWDEAIIITNQNLILKNGTKAPKLNSVKSKTETYRNNVLEYFKNENQ